MNSASKVYASLQSILRTQLPSKLGQFWLRHPSGLLLNRPVVIADCPTTQDDLLDKIFGLYPTNEVLFEMREHPWLLVQHVIPVGSFGSSSFLVCRIDDDIARLYMIDTYEQCESVGPKTPYPVTDCDLDSL